MVTPELLAPLAGGAVGLIELVRTVRRYRRDAASTRQLAEALATAAMLPLMGWQMMHWGSWTAGAYTALVGVVQLSLLRRDRIRARFPPPANDAEVEAQVLELLGEKKMAAALDIYRDYHDVGLFEARNAIDKLARTLRRKQLSEPQG